MLKQLLPYLKRYRFYLIAGFFLTVLKNLFQSLSPQVVRAAVDSLSGTGAAGTWAYGAAHWMVGLAGWPPLIAFIVLMLGLELLSALFLYLMRQTLIVSSRKIEYDLRGDLFAHLQKLHVQFFQYARTGDLMSRLTNDLSNVREVLGPGIMYTANTVIAFIYVVPIMIHINPTLTLMAFVPLVVLSFATQRLSKLIHARSQRVQEKLSDLSSHVQENFSGIRVIKSYVQEDHEIDRFRILNMDYVRLNMDMVRVRGALMSSVILTIGLSVTVLLWMGGRLVMAGTITIGEFTAFNFYLAMLIWPMIAVGWVMNIFQRGASSMTRLTELLQTEPAIRDHARTRPVTALRGKIEFRNLTFSYDGNGTTVLRNLSVTVEPGTTLGIVGATGSGKSTFVSLIPRLYDAPPGTLFIDDMDIRDIPVDVLRSHIGMVPQDTFLFSDTILNNIVFGVPEHTMDQVLWAADVAQLRGNVEEFPEQYATVIGERGLTLSGGQKQRLAIARAVIRQPRILILDDALSSVDTHTEDAILSGLRSVMAQRTSLIVSHRIQTVRSAGHIILLEEGAVVEEGTHEELMALGGDYAAMYRRQLIEEEIKAI